MLSTRRSGERGNATSPFPMRMFVQYLAVFLIALTYVIGGHFAFEFEHSHPGHHSHHHDHHDHDHEHGHEHESPSDDHGDGSKDPNQHSHYIVLGVSLVSPLVDENTLCLSPVIGFRNGFAESDRCPDGPYFEPVKPPQLG